MSSKLHYRIPQLHLPAVQQNSWVLIVTADSLLLCLSKSHDYDVVSDQFYTFQIGQFLQKGSFKLFWRRRTPKGIRR